MNHLVEIRTIADEEVQAVSARSLHLALGSGRDFSTWIKARIEHFGFEQGVDFEIFDSPDLVNQKQTEYKVRGGDRKSVDYILTLDMAKELAMVENNEKGREIRRYFIAVEKAARQTGMPMPELPKPARPMPAAKPSTPPDIELSSALNYATEVGQNWDWKQSTLFFRLVQEIARAYLGRKLSQATEAHRLLLPVLILQMARNEMDRRTFCPIRTEMARLLHLLYAAQGLKSAWTPEAVRTLAHNHGLFTNILVCDSSEQSRKVGFGMLCRQWNRKPINGLCLVSVGRGRDRKYVLTPAPQNAEGGLLK